MQKLKGNTWTLGKPHSMRAPQELKETSQNIFYCLIFIQQENKHSYFGGGGGKVGEGWRKKKVISFQTVEALLVEWSFSSTVN